LANGIVKDEQYENVYIGDVFSFAISHIQDNSIWVPIHNNVNVVAIATLREVQAIILTEGVKPDPDMLKTSIEQQIPIFTTELSHFETARLLILKEKGDKNEALL